MGSDAKQVCPLCRLVQRDDIKQCGYCGGGLSSHIETLKNECELSKKEAAAIVDLFFESMSEALAKGDRVEIRGLCSFYVKEYKSYLGRNPKTGESVQISPKKLPILNVARN
jgi:integration host factor subunit beta